MKSALALALLLCASFGFGAEKSPVSAQKLFILGKEYFRLDQWARANGYQWKWISKKDASVWNNSWRMQFTADSKKMTLNGTTVWLSETLRVRGDVPHLSAVDLSTAIQPVLFPPKGRPGTKTRHICIDPGHGGKDPGNREGREQEKKYTLLLAQELGAQLRAAGFTVSFTRTGDSFVSLPGRPELARKRGADLFVSLHFNSGPFTSSRIGGVEVFCMTPARTSSTNARGEGGNSGAYGGNANNSRNMLLAYQVNKSIVRSTGLEDRGVKRARFQILREATMPAVLVEAGFMSNPNEAKKIYSAAWRKQLAQSIASGITSYRNLVDP
jgi:N-acetylmuramoyl-L-alanine amidase